MVDSIGTDIGEIKPAIWCADRPLGEDEAFLHQLGRDPRRHDARDPGR
jgi:hypothetical protein